MDYKQIRVKRKSLRLSVEALALKLGVSKDNLFKWEKGTAISDPVSYNKIDAWLKVETIPKEAGKESNKKPPAGEPETVEIPKSYLELLQANTRILENLSKSSTKQSDANFEQSAANKLNAQALLAHTQLSLALVKDEEDAKALIDALPAIDKRVLDLLKKKGKPDGNPRM